MGLCCSACGSSFTPSTETELTEAEVPGSSTLGQTPSTGTSSTAETDGNSLATMDDSPPTTTMVDLTGAESTGDSESVPEPPHGLKCDSFKHDCPAGMKCNWYSYNDEFGIGDATRCVPLARTPAQFRESCVTDGEYGGVDTCDVGLTCWDVNGGIGWCVELCKGSYGDPVFGFPSVAGCFLGNGPYLCTPSCNPLGADCNPVVLALCTPIVTEFHSSWMCGPDINGMEGDFSAPCSSPNECNPGLVCAGSSSAQECDQMQSSCCSPLCDLDKANSCPGMLQSCTPWYPDNAPRAWRN